LRRFTSFEPLSVNIGQGVWALHMGKNKVRPKREGKERKGKKTKGQEENELEFSHSRGGKRYCVITTILCTRVEVNSVMTLAHFGVDILRDMDFGGGSTNLGVSFYFVIGPYNYLLNANLVRHARLRQRNVEIHCTHPTATAAF
jgi:hypothetical protein